MFFSLVILISLAIILLLLYPLLSSKAQSIERGPNHVNDKSRIHNQKELVNENNESKDNTLTIIASIVLIPIFSIAVYQYLGSGNISNSSDNINESALASQNMEDLLQSIEQTIQDNPNEIEARVALAQVYAEMERFSDAAAVFGELHELQPSDPDFLVNYAEALARSHGNRLTGKPAELLEQALVLEPNHGRALWLSGFAEKQAGNNQLAMLQWQQLLSGMEAGSPVYNEIEALIKETKNVQPTITTDVENRSLHVNVSLSPELKANPSTSLFIFARAAEGPPMPLAVHRGLAKDLPVEVILDDSMAMMPQMSISSFNAVIVVARLSQNGQPQGQSGDYEGLSDIIELPSNNDIDIVIDRIKP